MTRLNQQFQFPFRGAGIDRTARESNPLFQRGCHARDVDGRTRVEQYRRARSAPVHPGQHRLENFRILLRIPAPELLRRIDGSEQKFRQKFAGDDAAVAQFRNPGGGTAADLIEPVEPVHHQRPADAELLINRKTTCMKGIPINPGGIPTPATLTLAALDLSEMPCYIVNGGCSVVPYVPFFDMGGECGDYITTGKAVKNVRTEFEKGVMLGRMLAKSYDFVVISESCAGGTTTALAVMTAMGVLKENIVSSSSPNNPKELKSKTVAEALKAAGIEPGDLADDPLRAIECVGDPMMPANIGIVCGAAPHVPVIIGGGTQMGAIIASVIKLHPELIGNIVQGTTRWLMGDVNSNMRRIIDIITPDVPAVYVNVDYSGSPYEGLQAYEWGYIKEGAGCGGSSVGAIAMSAGEITADALEARVEEIYREIMGDALAP